MSWKRKRLVLVMSAIVAASALLPATAAARSGGAAHRVESHCVVYVVGQVDDGTLMTSEPDCFETESEAAVTAASGNLQAQSAGLDSMALGASTFILGIHYDGANGTGSSVTVVGTSCTGGYWNTPTWFDNRITSSYNGCGRLRHFDRPYTGGSSTNTYGAGTTDNLSSWMNNRTESVAYYSS